MKKVVNVAVIGAGAAGLCALRLLNHSPKGSTVFKAVAFEQSTQIGGTWYYTDCVATDEHGIPVHSSMYKSLRTNLPKEIMAYPDYPFPSHLKSYLGHSDVQKYLEDYATHFELWESIKFKTIVENIKPLPDEDNKFGVKWEITTADVTNREEQHLHLFDAVLVCNGHFSKPMIPSVPGLETFEGHLLHSHDYREPHAYADKTVVVLGAQSSGQDICLDVGSVAKQVYLCHNKPRLTTFLPSNVEQKPGIKHCHKRVLEFQDGSALEVDAIILCTGYLFDFHFLDESIGIKVEEERVTPLFKHLIHVDFPSLGMVGIVKTVIPFPLFYMQIQYFRSILDGSGTVPSREEMLQDEEESFILQTNRELPPRFAHILSNKQFDYWKQLADLGHFEYLPPHLEKIYKASHLFKKANVTTYRSINFILSTDTGEFTVVDGERKT